MENDKLLIGYTDGSSKEFELRDGVINREMFKSDSSICSVTFPSGLKEIGSQAFSGCINLGRIHFNNGSLKIMENAFEWCASLTDITLDSVEQVGINAFQHCTNLRNVKIGEGCRELQSGAFKSCCKLQTVTLPSSLEVIGSEVFIDCNRLRSIEIPEGCTLIGEKAFYGCENLLLITIPKSATDICISSFHGTKWLENKRRLLVINDTIVDAKNCTGSIEISGVGASVIGRGAFEGSPIRKVIISDDIKEIKDEAFSCCENLVNVKLSNSVRRIEDRAFAHCNCLTQVSLPIDLEYISPYAFAFSERLEYLDIDGVGGSYFSHDGVIYKGSFSGGNALWIVPPGREIVHVPNGTQYIEDLLIYDPFTNLQELYLPDSIQFTDEYCAKVIDFYGGEMPENVWLTLYCHAGSAAERFAQKFGFNYKLY